jgi:hypothetical protein
MVETDQWNNNNFKYQRTAEKHNLSPRLVPFGQVQRVQKDDAVIQKLLFREAYESINLPPDTPGAFQKGAGVDGATAELLHEFVSSSVVEVQSGTSTTSLQRGRGAIIMQGEPND